MLFRTKLVTALAVGLVASTSVIGAPVTSSGPIDIGFDINFFGNTYSQLYMYNNGSISFSGEQAVYTGSSMPNTKFAPDPLISPLTFDTDIHNAGWGWGAGTGHVDYKGTGLKTENYWFGTWDIDGPGEISPNWRNRIEVWIIDRSDTGVGNFDFAFAFNTIWDTTNVWDASFFGYGVEGNLYGYSTDTDHLLTLNANQLPYHSLNSDRTGYYVFEVRNGVVTNPLPFLTTIVPEPETWAMLLAGLGIVSMVTRRQSIKAAM